ncbi:hypothetical protein PG989_000886 [Apiospora arundinis]
MLTREPTCEDLQSLVKPVFFPLQYDEAKTCTVRPFQYLEIPTTEICTLVDQVEKRTARDIDIIEIDERGLGWDKFKIKTLPSLEHSGTDAYYSGFAYLSDYLHLFSGAAFAVVAETTIYHQPRHSRRQQRYRRNRLFWAALPSSRK